MKAFGERLRASRGQAVELAPVAGLTAAISGGILYLVLLRLCQWIYAPIGITPDEVGLTYGALLVRTALAWLTLFLNTTASVFFGAVAGFGLAMAYRYLAGAAVVLGTLGSAALTARATEDGLLAASESWLTNAPTLIASTLGVLFVLIAIPGDHLTAWRRDFQAGLADAARNLRASIRSVSRMRASGAARRTAKPPATSPNEVASPESLEPELSDRARPASAEPSFWRLDGVRRTDRVPDRVRLRLWIVAIVAPLALVSLNSAFLYFTAENDRERLVRGRAATNLFSDVPLPWDSDVVRVHAAERLAGLSLPSCLLFLGGADGISVYFDASQGQKRALRIPNSAVAMEVVADHESAVPPPHGPHPCRARRAPH